MTDPLRTTNLCACGPVSIIIKDSPIHGRGVFAARDISAGEIIIDWKQCKNNLNASDIEQLSSEERKRVSVIDGQHVLFKPPASCVNHSCEPNARGGNGCDVATRAIHRGEEITVDYIAEKVPHLNLRCNCGAKQCRGILVSH